jgi:UDP-N-acetylglucosamine 2-epimerase (non-hydrolysing)
VMIDTLYAHLGAIRSMDTWHQMGLNRGADAVLTLHRPSNVDDREALGEILDALRKIAKHVPIVFPIHPRTRQAVRRFGYENDLRFLETGSSSQGALRRSGVIDGPGIWCCAPLGYLEFQNLVVHCQFVMTDSGGIQEETTVLDIPCLTLRENTERPVTISRGTNQLVGHDGHRIVGEGMKILQGEGKHGQSPPLWDGRASERIVAILGRAFGLNGANR